MRVHAKKQRAINSVLLSVQTDRLADGQDMPLIKSPSERRTAMPRGSEGNPLRRHRRVRRLGIIGCNELGDINQHSRL